MLFAEIVLGFKIAKGIFAIYSEDCKDDRSYIVVPPYHLKDDYFINLDERFGHLDRCFGHLDRCFEHLDRCFGHLDRCFGHLGWIVQRWE